MLASQAIKAGRCRGGWWPAVQESMCRAPRTTSYGMRAGIKAGNQTMVDGNDPRRAVGTRSAAVTWAKYAEYTAQKAGVSREDQDAYSFESHSEGHRCDGRGEKFKAETIPVPVQGKEADRTTVSGRRGAAEGHQRRVARAAQAGVQEGTAATVTAGQRAGPQTTGREARSW